MKTLIQELKEHIGHFVIIGSYPLGTRFSKDVDVICYSKDVLSTYSSSDPFVGKIKVGNKPIELLFADDQQSFQFILSSHKNSGFATWSELYALKRGHIQFSSKKFDIHMMDLHFLKNMIGNLYKHQDTIDLIRLHRKSTEHRLDKKQKTPKLNGVTKEDFFDDYVEKFLDHDDIHRVMAYTDKPMFMKMQENSSLVECSKYLWGQFTEQEKDWCVLEECMVIAIERHLLPQQLMSTPPEDIFKPRKYLDDYQAFKWALMRVCTTLCSGFFRDHAIDNYFRILN